MKTLCLCDIDVGQQATVVDLLCRGSIRRRLMDIGIIKGTRITCLGKSPLGDPRAYLVRGAVIALRCEDSSNIIVGV